MDRIKRDLAGLEERRQAERDEAFARSLEDLLAAGDPAPATLGPSLAVLLRTSLENVRRLQANQANLASLLKRLSAETSPASDAA